MLPRIIQEVRQLYIEISQLARGGTITVPKPIPETTIPVISPLLAANHLATVGSNTGQQEPSPAAIIIPYIRYTCQMALTDDINIRLTYAMSTSDTSKNVQLIFRYDYYEVDDIIGSPSASNTQTTIIVPPDTMNQYQSYTDSVLKIPATDITNSFQYCVCSIERDVTVTDNHGGKFQLIGITMNQ